MYSLPITTYSDCWRATKIWSSYIGGLAMFAASTQYSTLRAPNVPPTLRLPIQQTTQLSNTSEIVSELSFLDFRQRLLTQSTVSREASSQGKGTMSRGLSVQVETSQRNLNQGAASMRVTGQEMLGPGILSPEVGSRITGKTEVEEKEVPFETVYVESDQLPPGMSQIKEEGDTGLLHQVVTTFEVGGQPIDQQVQSSYEVKRPKKRVIIRNSKPVGGESFDLNKFNISQALRVEATAYTYTGNKTATGVAAREGLIAVDPKVIAMGSKVYVEGYGYALAADTGGDIRGNRIDVFFSTFRQCVDWGRRKVHIYVLKSN